MNEASFETILFSLFYIVLGLICREDGEDGKISFFFFFLIANNIKSPCSARYFSRRVFPPSFVQKGPFTVRDPPFVPRKNEELNELIVVVPSPCSGSSWRQKARGRRASRLNTDTLFDAGGDR